MEFSGNAMAERPKSSFEEQFANIHTLKNKRESIKFVVLEPDNPQNAVLILLAPGWSETSQTYKNALRVVFDRGLKAFALDHPRTGGEDLSDSFVLKSEARKARSILKVIAHLGMERVDVITHSEGAINVCLAASLYPERFRNIVIVAAAGLEGNIGLSKLLLRYPLMFAREALKSNAYAERGSQLRNAGILKYLAENPKRSLAEIKDISKADISELLADLEKLGVNVSLIHGVDDSLFPMKRVVEESRNRQLPPTVRGFYTVKGGHTKLARDPLYIELALDALKNLADLKSNHSTAHQQTP